MSEYLAIDGIALNVEGCCKVRDLGPILNGSEHRGSDRLVPGSAGVIANPRRIDVTVVNLPLMLFGRRSFTGTLHPDQRTGLALNVAYIQKNITKPITTGTGTRTATLHWEAQPTLSKPVHVLGGLDLAGDGPPMLRGVLRLSFPEGVFNLADWLP